MSCVNKKNKTGRNYKTHKESVIFYIIKLSYLNKFNKLSPFYLRQSTFFYQHFPDKVYDALKSHLEAAFHGISLHHKPPLSLAAACTSISDSWVFKQKAWPLYRKDFLQVTEKSGDMITKIGYKSASHSVQRNMPGRDIKDVTIIT